MIPVLSSTHLACTDNVVYAPFLKTTALGIQCTKYVLWNLTLKPFFTIISLTTSYIRTTQYLVDYWYQVPGTWYWYHTYRDMALRHSTRTRSIFTGICLQCMHTKQVAVILLTRYR